MCPLLYTNTNDIHKATLNTIVGNPNILVTATNKKSGKKIKFVKIIKLAIGLFNSFFAFINIPHFN